METWGIFGTTLLAAILFAGGFCAYWRVIHSRWSPVAFFIPLIFCLALFIVAIGLHNLFRSF